MINSDNSIQINIKFTFTGYEYIIVYKYILLSNLISIYTYIYIYIIITRLVEIFRLISRQLYYKETPTQVFSCEYCKIFKNLYFKGHLWTTASELYWFKAEEIIEKQRRIQRRYSEKYSEPSETSKMKLFAKIVDCI